MANQDPDGIEDFICSTLAAVARMKGNAETRRLRFGSADVNLHFPGDPKTSAVVERLLSGLHANAVTSDPFASADYDLFFVAGDQTAIGAPPAEWPFATNTRDLFHRVHWDRARRLALTSDERATIWNLADLRQRQGLSWIGAPERLPSWEFAAPFRHHVHWIALDRDGGMVHAAALGDGRGAFLLSGPGGAGKSTMAVAALATGHSVLAEDLSLCEETADSLRVHPLYRTFKVTSEARRAFPFIEDFATRHRRLDGEKTLVYGDATADATADVEIRALYSLSGQFANTTQIETCSRGMAFRLLAPSTVFLMRTAVQETSARLRRLVERLPVFHVTLGGEPRAAVMAIFAHFGAIDARRND